MTILLVRLLVSIMFATSVGTSFAASEPEENAFLVFSVKIGSRSGIYLGDGLVLTAQHVVGDALTSRPIVIIDGKEFSTKIVQEGAFEVIDLTLLSVDVSKLPAKLQLRRNPVCKVGPYPGQRVATVEPQKTVLSEIISPNLISAGARKFDTAVVHVPGIGNSGAGVFDLQRKCLLGIISRSISRQIRTLEGRTETKDIARYFVPAKQIMQFLPARYRSTIQ